MKKRIIRKHFSDDIIKTEWLRKLRKFLDRCNLRLYFKELNNIRKNNKILFKTKWTIFYKNTILTEFLKVNWK